MEDGTAAVSDQPERQLEADGGLRSWFRSRRLAAGADHGLRSWFRSLPPAIRIAAAAAAVVAAGAALLSWSALTWAASELGIDEHVHWIFGVVVDGAIVVGTAGVLALAHGRARTRAYVWSLLGLGLAISVVGNGAHAKPGGPVFSFAAVFGLGPLTLTLHQLGSAVPAVLLAASLHVLVIMVRASEQQPLTEAAPAAQPSSLTPAHDADQPQPNTERSGRPRRAGQAIRKALTAGSRRPAQERVVALIEQLADERSIPPAEVEAADVAERLGLPRDHSSARRWVARAKATFRAQEGGIAA